MHKQTQQVFNKFEKWMDERNSKIHEVLIKYKGYLPFDETFGVYRDGQKQLPHAHIPYVIQQVEQEIKSLVDALYDNLTDFSKCLEIGMGDFGGTHTIFKQVFSEAYVIEREPETTQRYMYTNQYGVCPIDHRDKIIIGDSTDIGVIKVVSQVAPFNFLFIDGGHLYHECRPDFDTYYPMVCKGGIIALHDTNNPNFGIKKMVTEIKNELNVEIIPLHFSVETGISYFIK